MKALFFIAGENLKKKKGDAVVLFLLIALATILFYTSVSVFGGIDQVVDKAYDKAQTADLFFMSNVEEERVREIMTAREEMAAYEASQCLYFIEVDYRKEEEKEKNQGQFFFGRIEEERKIGKLVGSEDVETGYDSILLPYYMKAAEGYSVGDICYFTYGDEEYRFEVAGFVEDPLFATPVNVSVYGAYISAERMEDLLSENPIVEAARYTQHKVRLKEGEDSYEFDKKLTPILTQEIPELSLTTNLGLNWKTMRGGVGMMSRISMGIILVFSLLLILVALIIIRFSIRNHIEMNLKNVGILQAAGYTSVQLNISVLIEMGIVSFIGVIAGILIGVAGSSLIGKFEGIMSGLRWSQTFHPMAAGVTAIVIMSVVMAVAYLSGRIYKKLSVLESLRGGIHTHNFKKNYFGFDKKGLSVPLILAAKNFMHEKAKNFSIFCIVTILAFSACVGFGLYENFALNNDNLFKMVGAEAGDIMLTGENLEEIGEKLETWPEMEEVLYYSQGSLKLESKEEETAVTCDIWQQPELVHNEMIIRGRLPKYDNEIVLTTGIAKTLNVDVGDTIYVTGQDERMDYLVCGIDQKMNNMGLKAMLSQDGATRLNGSSIVTFLYIYTKEGIAFEEISTKILNEFPDVSVTDSEKMITNIMGGVTLAMVLICVIFVVITVVVVMMVEVLLVKSKVIRERKNLGLNKAIGFTTGQLILQMMFMNLPVITIGGICGVILSFYLMEPLVVVCLSYCGLEQCPFTINFFWMALTVVGIIVVAILASFLSALKIRQIEPVKMLTEE